MGEDSLEIVDRFCYVGDVISCGGALGRMGSKE